MFNRLVISRLSGPLQQSFARAPALYTQMLHMNLIRPFTSQVDKHTSRYTRKDNRFSTSTSLETKLTSNQSRMIGNNSRPFCCELPKNSKWDRNIIGRLTSRPRTASRTYRRSKMQELHLRIESWWHLLRQVKTNKALKSRSIPSLQQATHKSKTKKAMFTSLIIEKFQSKTTRINLVSRTTPSASLQLMKITQQLNS